jgi:hypothetical protein
MTKAKKLVKEALRHPELHTPGDLAYMQLWLNERKRRKAERKGQSVGEDYENLTTGLAALGQHQQSGEVSLPLEQVVSNLDVTL